MLLIKNARIHTITQGVIENGFVLIEGKRIKRCQMNHPKSIYQKQNY
jgi:hypothetical protein